MPRGAAKGERRGGRPKGMPNQKTIERALQAEADLTAAEVNGKKLGKDYLEQYTEAFHSIAAYYQNQIALAVQQGGVPPAAALAGFEKWGSLVVKAAREAAEFQSPKFRALAVAVAPGGMSGGVDPKVVDGTVVPLNDNVGASRVYRQIVKAALGAK